MIFVAGQYKFVVFIEDLTYFIVIAEQLQLSAMLGDNVVPEKHILIVMVFSKETTLNE